MNKEELKERIFEFAKTMAEHIDSKEAQIVTVPTKFKTGDKVFIYQKGQLQQHEIEEIDCHVTKTSSVIKYGFLFSKQTNTPVTWFAENEVFESKEEIFTR